MPRSSTTLSTQFREMEFLDRIPAAFAGFPAVECRFPDAVGIVAERT
jgi:hydroxypyruvate isomerase